MSRLLVLIALAVFPISFTHADSKSKPGYAARVASVEGSTLIRQDKDSSGKVGDPTPLKVGDQVFPGQVINTGSNGKVKLLLSDRSIVDIGPSSLFKVADFKAKGGGNRQVDVEMKYGSVRASITEKIKSGGHFRVKTPTATMGVRGTEFLVKADQGASQSAGTDGKSLSEATRTQMIVLQGSVVSQGITNAAPILVTPGKSLESGTGDVQMKAVDLADSNVQREVASYTIQPNTFSQAIGISSDNDSKGSSSLGESTLAVVKEAVKETSSSSVPLSSSGLFQSQNPTDWIQQDRNLTQGIPVPVTVKVTGF